GEAPRDGASRDQHRELPRRDQEVPRGALVVKLLEELVRDRLVELMAQVLGRLGPVVLARGEVLGTGKGAGGACWGGAHRFVPAKPSPGLPYSHTAPRP